MLASDKLLCSIKCQRFMPSYLKHDKQLSGGMGLTLEMINWEMVGTVIQFPFCPMVGDISGL